MENEKHQFLKKVINELIGKMLHCLDVYLRGQDVVSTYLTELLNDFGQNTVIFICFLFSK